MWINLPKGPLMPVKSVSIPAFCLILTACSGSGQNGPALAPPARFDEVSATSDSIFGSVAAFEYTALSTIPATGRATYTGVLEGQISDLPGDTILFIGNLSLTADFSDDRLIAGASSTSLFLENRTAVPGSLSRQTSEFFRTGDPEVDRTISIGLAGTITPPEHDAITLDLVLEGDFFGTDQTHIAGAMLGRAEENGITGTVTGRFGTEQE